MIEFIENQHMQMIQNRNDVDLMLSPTGGKVKNDVSHVVIRQEV